MTPPPRPFFLPMLGLVLLFAAFGPAIAGATFLPLAFLLEAPLAASAYGHIGWIATLMGHALALVPAYILGIGPAAATGFLFALWDAAAPERWPRALAAAAIGGALTYGLAQWLATLGAAIEASIRMGVSPSAGSWIDDLFSGEFDLALQHALIASGALAGLVCAMAAQLLGVTTRAALAPTLTPPAGA